MLLGGMLTFLLPETKGRSLGLLQPFLTRHFTEDIAGEEELE